MSTASLGIRILRYLRVSYRILERNFYESTQSNGVEQYSEQSRKPSSQQWILKKAERYIYHRCVKRDRPSNLRKYFLLVTLPYINDMISISIHKELQSYHQVFYCHESVNTKWENPMVYSANFTQCVCTGYCESWILSSLLLLWTLAIARKCNIFPSFSSTMLLC